MDPEQTSISPSLFDVSLASSRTPSPSITEQKLNTCTEWYFQVETKQDSAPRLQCMIGSNIPFELNHEEQAKLKAEITIAMSQCVSNIIRCNQFFNPKELIERLTQKINLTITPFIPGNTTLAFTVTFRHPRERTNYLICYADKSASIFSINLNVPDEMRQQRLLCPEESANYYWGLINNSISVSVKVGYQVEELIIQAIPRARVTTIPLSGNKTVFRPITPIAMGIFALTAGGIGLWAKLAPTSSVGKFVIGSISVATLSYLWPVCLALGCLLIISALLYKKYCQHTVKLDCSSHN